jgi:long-chain acyl-CoA synthetase
MRRGVIGQSGVQRLPAATDLDAFVARAVEAQPDPERSAPDCEALARAWRERGLRPGNLVLLCLPNAAELLHQFFGVVQAGGVPALLPPMLPAARLREIARRMSARAIAGLRLPLGDLGAERHVSAGRMQIAMLPSAGAPPTAPGEVVMLTSGTCGIASGCVFDVDALLVNGCRHADAIGQREDDIVLVSLPLYFSFALVAQALAALMRGSRLVIDGPPFNVVAYRSTLDDHQVTISSLTPVLVRAILRADASVLRVPRVLTVGGDVLDAAGVAELVRARQGRELYVTYGLTQAGPRVSTLAAHREPAARYSSVGVPLPGTTVSLVQADARGIRELHVASDTVMKRAIGYVEGRRSQRIGAGTVATGDAFEQDADGYLYFRGRLNDVISRHGEKINLAAVRRLALQLPDVVGVRTIVVDQESGGQDFDLELSVDPGTDGACDPRGLLRRLLQQTEMPREIRVQAASREGMLPHK